MPLALLPLLALLPGCTAEGNFTGAAYYGEPDDDSNPTPTRAPVTRDDGSDQEVRFDATFTGTGTFGDLLEVCIATDGALEGESTSYGSVDADGRFQGDVQAEGSEDSSITSSLGCVSEDVVVETLTSLTIRAEIAADTENCSHYCEAHAQAACEGDTDGASCESAVEADCYEECTTSRSSIVAETTISDSATLAGLVQDGTFGSFEADLEFTSME